ncbi:yippee zinc-binding/DNA-binding /Mis18, centromere assembly-domain-containing protein, partial [Staphylotrichum tortipilum]
LSRTHPSTLRCSICSSDLAFHSQIISKSFHGRHGRAYLVSPPSFPPPECPPGKTAPAMELINTRLGRAEDRHLTTGLHKVADVSCVGCGVVVGWKYIEARNPEQMYKEGKFILETRRVVGFHSWEDAELRSGESGGYEDEGDGEEEEAVVFDSEDEDECDDIFAGVWDPKVTAQRRRSRIGYLRTRGELA